MHFLSNSLHNPTPLSSRIGPSLSVDTKRRYDRCDRLFIIYGILCKNLITESKGTRPPLAGALRPPLQGARGIPADPAVPSHSSARYARLWQRTHALPLRRELSRRSSRSVCKGPAHVEQPDWEQCGEWRGSPTGKRKLSPSQPGLCAERLDGKGSAPSLRTPHCPPSGSTCPQPLPLQAMLTSRPRRTYPHRHRRTSRGARTLERKEKTKKDAAS